jgi:ring-1,2-phenylacetyl-CoA epoxidase subunit PaaC
MYNNTINYLLHLADTTLILSQRNSEWCGHGPILEQDIALTNISLDILGQARNFYQHAATLINQLPTTTHQITEDDLAYVRKERDFKNLLLVEQPNGHWGQTILRQYLFSQYQFLLFTQLQKIGDEQLAAITTKALKEITYHVRWSSEWVIRLGDGTDESRQKMIEAIDALWMYVGEMFLPAVYEPSFDIAALHAKWLQQVTDVFNNATLSVPQHIFAQTGGKNGVHTEHLGYMLTDLQYVQRTYPGAQW